MSLPIITADQRLAERRGVKAAIFGQSGRGKTSLLWTLRATTTLFVDLEAGDLAVEGWAGDTIRPRTWNECRDFAVFVGGPNPALRNDQSYSEAHYSAVCAQYGDPAVLDRYETVFIDSITVAGRLCFTWCSQQSENRNERSGKLDTRAVYGMHGREMMAWLTHLQHIRSKNVIFVGILDESVDEYGRKQYDLQIDGNKTGRELPGIVDEVITMAVMTGDEGPYRAFVCQTLNQWGCPAKDRSGRLDVLEEPHLGKLIAKMGSGAPAASRPMTFIDPNTQNPSERN